MGTLATALKAARQREGISQEALARAAGLNLRQVQRLERGSTEGPRIDTVAALARGLGMPLWRLLYEVETGMTPAPNSEDSKLYFLGKTPLAETERRGWARALLGTEDVTQADEEALARLVGELDETERLLVSRALDVLADHAERLAPPDAAEPAKPRAKARRRAR